MPHPAIAVARFAALAFVSKRVGAWGTRFKLPVITGFLLTGMLAGPFLSGYLSKDSLVQLQWIDSISLALIAFIAGNELQLAMLRRRWKSISRIMLGQTLVVFGLGSLLVYMVSLYIPFMSMMSDPARVGVSLLVGAILVARSPSSAIAIVNEMGAKGPFTETVLGVTMLTDVVVIALFTISFSLAKTFVSGGQFQLMTLVSLALELGLALMVSWLLRYVFATAFRWQAPRWLLTLVLMGVGYGVFVGSHTFLHWTQHHLPFGLHVEPLLVCMLAGAWMANLSEEHPAREPFASVLHEVAPLSTILFFTMTGAALGIDILLKVWPIALALVGIRLVLLFAGSAIGGMAAGDPGVFNRTSWMAYLTQAGVCLGLAKQVAVAFPSWGAQFAAIIIASVVLNQLIGPPLFKAVVQIAGEANQETA